MVILTKTGRRKSRRQLSEEEKWWADAQFREGTAEPYEGAYQYNCTAYGDAVKCGFQMMSEES